MRTYRTTSGPVRERPYFEAQEIERICTSELRSLALLPETPGPTRIDRFVEKRFGHVDYEDLPLGILGYTRFGPNGVEKIVVSRSLAADDQVSSERRISTTLAHEAGHGLLHAHLFALGEPARSLFDDDANSEPMRILCRDDGSPDPVRVYDGRWWEFQANQAIGALLLPAFLVRNCLDDTLEERGLLGRRVLPTDRRAAAVERLAGVFEVNRVVARIRLDQLYPLHEEQQLTL